MQLQNLLSSLATLLAGLAVTTGGMHGTTTIPAPSSSTAQSAVHATTSAPIGVLAPSKKPVASKATTTPAKSAVSSALEGAPSTELALALGHLRDATVNIICVTRDNSVRSVSGSGVLISSKGLILTVAHVGQYFLLQTLAPGNAVCVIRTGNPARNAYYAEPVYVSGSWVHDHPSTLIDAAPSGTGQDDFTVLAVTGSVTSAPLPASFPFVPLTTNEPALNQPVAIGSYAAQTLTSDQIRSSLYPTLVFGSVKQRFTFGVANTLDLISLGGGIAAQEGSSGGGIVNDKGELMGVITTSTVSGTFASRDLRAITASHIRRSYSNDVGGDFDTAILAGDPENLVEKFVNRAKTLAGMLKSGISSKR